MTNTRCETLRRLIGEVAFRTCQQAQSQVVNVIIETDLLDNVTDSATRLNRVVTDAINRTMSITRSTMSTTTTTMSSSTELTMVERDEGDVSVTFVVVVTALATVGFILMAGCLFVCWLGRRGRRQRRVAAEADVQQVESPLVHASRERVRRPTSPRPSILPLSPAVQKLVRQGEVEAAGDLAHVEEIAPQMRAEEVAPVLIGGEVEPVGLIGGEVEQVGLIGGELEQVEEQNELDVRVVARTPAPRRSSRFRMAPDRF